MLRDVIELTNMIKTGLEDEKLDSIIELYDNYRLLNTALNSAYVFINGYFGIDINDPIFQKTESFLTPQSKWIYFSQKELKSFNDDVLKFIRHCCFLGFDKDSNIAKMLSYNLGRFSVYVPFNNSDNKFDFSCNSKEIIFQLMVFEKPNEDQCIFFNTRDNLHIEKTFDIETKIQKEELLNTLKQNINKLEQFKIFLEDYFLEHNIPKKLFVKVKKGPLCLNYIEK